jgi:hypothetical protein
MTQHFVVYSSADLVVRASGTCEDGMVAAQAIEAGTAAKQIDNYYPPAQLNVVNESGNIVVYDTNTSQRVDIIRMQANGTVIGRAIARAIAPSG